MIIVRSDLIQPYVYGRGGRSQPGLSFFRHTASPTVTPHAFAATPGYATAYHPLVTGQLTVTKTRILGSDTWQTTTLYYDDLGRVIRCMNTGIKLTLKDEKV